MERTLALIKPDAWSNGLPGQILDDIIQHKFTIVGLKLLRLSKEDAMKFYDVHADRSFYDDLTSFMACGPLVAIVLEKDNAVQEFRNLIGSTDPSTASEFALRRKYGTTMRYNALHGSDSVLNAEKEISFFFSRIELL